MVPVEQLASMQDTGCSTQGVGTHVDHMETPLFFFTSTLSSSHSGHEAQAGQLPDPARVQQPEGRRCRRM